MPVSFPGGPPKRSVKLCKAYAEIFTRCLLRSMSLTSEEIVICDRLFILCLGGGGEEAQAVK